MCWSAIVYARKPFYTMWNMLCALTLENAYVDSNTYSEFYIRAVYVKGILSSINKWGLIKQNPFGF